MKNFLIAHLTQIATYATIIVIFTHNVLFDREMACTCKNQKFQCDVYMAVPYFIIFLMLLWKDKNFNGACRAFCWCMKTRRESQDDVWCVILIQIVKAAVISLLWVVSVLFDGDWYACCQNNLQGEEAQIPCKTNRSLEEQVKIDELKNCSKIKGLFILLGLLILVAAFSLLKLSNCCKKCSSYIDGNGPYELIIIQEEENIVNQILKERAKKALSEKVKEILEQDKSNNYLNCFDAAQQVINQEWPEVNQAPGADVTAPPPDPAPGADDKASPSDPPSGSKKDNKAETHSPGKKDSGEGGKAPPSSQAMIPHVEETFELLQDAQMDTDLSSHGRRPTA